MNTNEYRAKSDGTTLIDHSVAVAKMAEQTGRYLGLEEKDCLWLKKAGAFHDIGKIHQDFQDWVKGGKTDEKYYKEHFSHNELSFLAIHDLIEDSELMQYLALYHHGLPWRSEENFLEEAPENTINPQMSIGIEGFLEAINRKLELKIFLRENPPDELKIPPFQKAKIRPNNNKLYYEHYINENAKRKLLLSILINADRTISADSEINLENTPVSSEESINEFYKNNKDLERKNDQENCAKKIKERIEKDNISILQGPAGCGKTIISLMAANNQKMLYIVPTKAVALSLYDQLKRIMKDSGVSIEILTGDQQKISINGSDKSLNDEDSIFESDIVITTIDRISDTLVTHRKLTTLFEFINRFVVFDEYHVLSGGTDFPLILAQLVKIKKRINNVPGCLLMSATLDYLYNKELLGIIEDNSIIHAKSFNKTLYTFKEIRSEYVPFKMQEKQQASMVCFSNTATDAQTGSLNSQNIQCYTNKILKHARTEIREKLMNTDSPETTYTNSVSSISENFSWKEGVFEYDVFGEILQRLGRISRYGEYEHATIYLFEGDNTFKTLDKLFGRKAEAEAFYKFAKTKLIDGEFTINDLYKMYENFQKELADDEAVKTETKDRWKKAKKKELNFKPYKTKKDNKTKKAAMKKISMRDPSLGVNAVKAILHENGDLEITNEYILAKDAPITDLTYPEDQLIFEGYISKAENNYEKMTGKKLNKYVNGGITGDLKQLARTEHPVYLSYTEDDIKRGLENPENPVYYVCKEEQDGVLHHIGLMAKKKI